MTIEEQIKILEAARDGKTLQLRDAGSNWYDIKVKNEDGLPFVDLKRGGVQPEYRIKPEISKPINCWKTKCAELMQEILTAIPLDAYTDTVKLNMNLIAVWRKFLEGNK